MSRRVFVTVKRGMTDATAVCIFPWEIPLLAHIHGQEIAEQSIEQMSTVKDGVVKKEKIKFKYQGLDGPSLRHQLEVMVYVDPEEDPALDPATEYQRMADKYGMDKDLPIPVVTRVFGEFSSGAFEAKLKEFAKERLPKPNLLKARDEGLDGAPDQLSVAELRDALDVRQIVWTAKDTKQILVKKLEEALVPE